MNNRKIVLASKSPRRKRLLEQIGLRFEIRESEYEEDMRAVDDPYTLAKFLALKKTEDVARHYDDAIVIGADTFIVFDNKFVGKPKDADEAREMLNGFSDNEHRVVTGFAVIDTVNNAVINDYDEAIVKFRPLTDDEIGEYIATGEPLDKAGAYGIQERGAIFIESLRGDYFSVVGLPLRKVYSALRKLTK